VKGLALATRNGHIWLFFMSKIDYLRKSKVLKTDLCKRINKLDKKTYLNSLEGVITDPVLDNEYFDLLMAYDYEDIKEARKINKANYYRVRRLKERIATMISSKPCVWCTFNFDDDTLNKTNEDTRRQYVRRFLKAFNCEYIANIDYGSNRVYKDRKGNTRQATEREHYHALIQIDKIPKGSWSHGMDYYKRVRTNQNTSDIKLSKYISKLTNHAIKESTKRCTIIYSR